MTRLDLALAVLVGIALVIAGACALMERRVPGLVEVAGFTCLGSIARGHVHRIRKGRQQQ